MDDSRFDSLFSLCLDEEVVEEEAFICSQNFECSSDYEYLQILFDKEKELRLIKDESMDLGNWIKRARLEAITWILNTRAVLGFRCRTAYISITYLDRFLHKRFIDGGKSWAIRLLSVACLSLAAKMEELEVTCLSDFQDKEYIFESKVIQRMELLVLSSLEWEMGSITPFDFLHFFIKKLSDESPPSNDFVSRTVQLILGTMRETNLMEHRPSAIAAAAALMALNQRLTQKEFEFHANSIGFLELEDLSTCYNLMQKLRGW